MKIKKDSILYARMDYRVVGKDLTDKDFQDHLSYVNSIAKERYLLGGGFSNTDGGMILFEAKNFDDAQSIADNDPIIKRGIYRCEIFVWELKVLSEGSSTYKI
ncbi:MAG: YciI family protein [Oscillospiraceae bacterium]